MADLVVPQLGESISEAVIAKWLKQVGEPIAVDEPVVDLETDKVSVALPAPAAGVLNEQRFAVGTTVKVGEIIGIIGPGAAATTAPPAEKKKTGKQSGPPAKSAPPVAAAPAPSTPAAAIAAPAIAQEHPVPHSRTLPPSVRKALREGANVDTGAGTPSNGNGAGARVTPITAVVARPDEEIVAMSPLRKRIAERLVEAQHTAAILTTFNEVDMSNVMALRARFLDSFVKQHGIKLGFMSFFVRACCESLRNFPGLNAEIHGTDIIYKKHYDFGIAVGSGRGLVVPVMRNVDRLGFAEIEKAIAELGKKARDNALTLDDLQGGTFTLSNGGIYGSMMSTPLLNMPQTGILGMHNIVRRAVPIGETIEIRPMMYLALSYDHRVVDGREAVQFLVGVKERIEAPERLLLEI